MEIISIAHLILSISVNEEIDIPWHSFIDPSPRLPRHVHPLAKDFFSSFTSEAVDDLVDLKPYARGPLPGYYRLEPHGPWLSNEAGTIPLHNFSLLVRLVPRPRMDSVKQHCLRCTNIKYNHQFLLQTVNIN